MLFPLDGRNITVLLENYNMSSCTLSKRTYLPLYMWSVKGVAKIDCMFTMC